MSKIDMSFSRVPMFQLTLFLWHKRKRQESPQREGEDPSILRGCERQCDVRDAPSLSYCDVLDMLCTQEERVRGVAVPAFPVHPIPIRSHPLWDCLLLMRTISWRYHSCFSMMSWSLVITGRPCVYIYTNVAETPYQWCWWHMQVSNLLRFIQAPATICS